VELVEHATPYESIIFPARLEVFPRPTVVLSRSPHPYSFQAPENMSSFLMLPLEIRREIYRFVLPTQDTIYVGTSDYSRMLNGNDVGIALSSLMFCRESYEEGARLFYSIPEFCSADHAGSMVKFLLTIRSTNVSRIRRISTEVSNVPQALSAATMIKILGSHRSLKSLEVIIFDVDGLTSEDVPSGIREDSRATFHKLFKALAGMDYLNITKVGVQCDITEQLGLPILSSSRGSDFVLDS
jgi:hypothetical protein